jgi:hypothetical protein
MNVFELYADKTKHSELAALLTIGAQQHPLGLADNFLEKDIWVTEILRLLYEEQLIGKHDIAFKGGTALSKCWRAIERFSEDIDLSIHWADLAEFEDENTAWQKTTRNRSQQDKFRKEQSKRLEEWSGSFVSTLNERLKKYEIDGLSANLVPDSNGEKIEVHFPRVTNNKNRYQLDYVLLEFGGRNRGRPAQEHSVTCYLSEVAELSSMEFPTAKVQAFDPAYILWEKLTALHQFSTQDSPPNPDRLARHWYDVDCLLNMKIADPYATDQAMTDVVEMKSHRWAGNGVDYKQVMNGQLRLIPDADRLKGISKDHHNAISGNMFFNTPDDFTQIIERLSAVESKINSMNDHIDEWLLKNHRLVYSGAWAQAVIEWKGKTLRSTFSLRENIEPSLKDLHKKLQALRSNQ